jgi:hypothetical protein
MFGDRVFEAVLNAGESESGASVHLVDTECDTGAVMRQACVRVLPGVSTKLAERAKSDVVPTESPSGEVGRRSFLLFVATRCTQPLRTCCPSARPVHGVDGIFSLAHEMLLALCHGRHRPALRLRPQK